MIQLIKKIFSFINIIYLGVFIKNVFFKGNIFFLVKISSKTKNNIIKISRLFIEKTTILIDGSLNEIYFTGAFISNCRININGVNNKFIIEEGVKLRGGTIHIRGNNCTIKIKKNTTFGGVRMVNVGRDNEIVIGENCLFADKIEIWASDTHSIYNNKNEMINPEKPISIGDRVWVGSHVIILKGVKIDDDSIIGMGSVVTKDVPKGVISAGIPNRSIKENITWDLEY